MAGTTGRITLGKRQLSAVISQMVVVWNEGEIQRGSLAQKGQESLRASATLAGGAVQRVVWARCLGESTSTPSKAGILPPEAAL